MKAEQQQFHGGLPSETKRDLSVLNTLGTHGHRSLFGEAQAQYLSSQQSHLIECRSFRPRHSQASRAWPSPKWAPRQCSRWGLAGWPNACTTSPCLSEPSRLSILSWISTFLSWCRSSENWDLSSPKPSGCPGKQRLRAADWNRTGITFATTCPGRPVAPC